MDLEQDAIDPTADGGAAAETIESGDALDAAEPPILHIP